MEDLNHMLVFLILGFTRLLTHVKTIIFEQIIFKLLLTHDIYFSKNTYDIYIIFAIRQLNIIVLNLSQLSLI